MIAAIRTKTGEIYWRQILPEGQTVTSLTISGKSLIVLSSPGGTIRSFSLSDGTFEWDNGSYTADKQNIIYQQNIKHKAIDVQTQK